MNYVSPKKKLFTLRTDKVICEGQYFRSRIQDNLGHVEAVVGLGAVSDGQEPGPLPVGQQTSRRRPERLNGAVAEEARGAEHLPSHLLGQHLDTGDLVLGQLAEDKVPQFLRLVAEVEDPAVLADDALHLLTDMDHELCLYYCIVGRANYANLKKGKIH